MEFYRKKRQNWRISKLYAWETELKWTWYEKNPNKDQKMRDHLACSSHKARLSGKDKHIFHERLSFRSHSTYSSHKARSSGKNIDEFFVTWLDRVGPNVENFKEYIKEQTRSICSSQVTRSSSSPVRATQNWKPARPDRGG